jgi:hypothetical protein
LVVVPGLFRSQAAEITAAIREEPPNPWELAAESVRLFRNAFQWRDRWRSRHVRES